MLPVIAAIGVGLSAAGTLTSIFGSKSAEKAQQRAIDGQQQSEEARYKAMKIDADRRRRQLIRQALIARSQALAVGTSQGATGAGGSGLPGAFGQIAGNLQFGLTGINQQEQLGEELFAANKNLLAARRAGASAETTSSIGKGLSSLGGQIVGNLGGIDRAFGNFGNNNSSMGDGGTFGADPRGIRGLY